MIDRLVLSDWQEQEVKRMKKAQGFTLVELMIVVSIAATITAIAFPNFSSARKAGNEVSAIASLRTLTTVNEQFRTRFGRYAPDLDSLVADTLTASWVGPPSRVISSTTPAASTAGSAMLTLSSLERRVIASSM